jgi:hypothetical protein
MVTPSTWQKTVLSHVRVQDRWGLESHSPSPSLGRRRRMPGPTSVRNLTADAAAEATPNQSLLRLASLNMRSSGVGTDLAAVVLHSAIIHSSLVVNVISPTFKCCGRYSSDSQGAGPVSRPHTCIRLRATTPVTTLETVDTARCHCAGAISSH